MAMYEYKHSLYPHQHNIIKQCAFIHVDPENLIIMPQRVQIHTERLFQCYKVLSPFALCKLCTI